MAWTAPRTWVTGETVTAALMNAHIKDNLLETSAATVTTAGDIAYADAANSMGSRLAIGATDTTLVSSGTAPTWQAPSSIIVVKQTDEVINSSTSLQDDDELLWAMGANESWAFVCHLLFTGTAAGDFKLDFQGPTDFTCDYNWGAVFSTGDTISLFGGGNEAGGMVATGATTTARQVNLMGSFETHGTAGNAQLRWAENTSTGNLTVHEGSMIMAHRAT